MQELLANPAVQSAAIPFIVALVLGWTLHRPRLSGLALPAALAVVTALAAGFSFEPLTATRKLVLTGVACALPVLWLALRRTDGPRAGAVLAALAAAASAWMLLRILEQREPAPAVALGLAAAVYAAALVEGGRRFTRDPVAASAAALFLGLGYGALALLGASALLAQFGIALGAAAGAILLVQMLRGPSPAPAWSLVLPVAVAGSMAGLLAVFTGALPWYCLLPMLAVPWAASLPGGGDRRPTWLAAILSSLAALVPALLAVVLAWMAARAAG